MTDCVYKYLCAVCAAGMVVRAGQEFRLRVPVFAERAVAPVTPVDSADDNQMSSHNNHVHMCVQQYLLQWELCLLGDTAATTGTGAGSLASKTAAAVTAQQAKGMTIGFSVMLQRPDGLLPQIYSYR